MNRQQVNQISGKTILALSMVALLTVLSGYMQAPQAGEGASAHIFQIAIVLLAATLMVFLVTADWRQRWCSARPLALPGIALVAAFSALYYLEHYFYLTHPR